MVYTSEKEMEVTAWILLKKECTREDEISCVSS